MSEDERLRDRLADELDRARRRTALLTDSVDDQELTAQHSVLMSPLVWDLAHIGNQEELWLVRDVGGSEPVRADIDTLYDAFEHPRASRPTLPLLDPSQSRGYVATVRDKTWDVLGRSTFGGRRLEEGGFAFAMVAQHEQQHDETMLATHQLRSGPAVLRAPAPPHPEPAVAGAAPVEVVIPGGAFTMGTSVHPWALDNERPAHRVHVPGFAIETFPVTNERWIRFIDDGGYRRRELWSDRGWDHVRSEELVAPRFWHHDGTRWYRTSFGVTDPVAPDEAVVHVCWFEAEAFARWAGKRLPTEPEWEKAALYDPATGESRPYPWGWDEPDDRRANLGQQHLRPAAAGAYPDGASASGVHQLVGDVWEWTSSGFEPYPRFAAFPYREYSEVFLGGDYRVLRGGSFGTDPLVARGTFRNWDHPIRRQIFAGVRLARDLEPGEG